MEKNVVLILAALAMLLLVGCKERISDDLPISEQCNCNIPEGWWSAGRTVVDLAKFCSAQCGFNVTEHNILITLKK